MSQIHKEATKAALDSFCAQIDENFHRSHEGRDRLKPSTLTKIVDSLKGEFTWITCNIIDKDYRKHYHSFVEASSLRLGGAISNIQDTQDIQVNTQVIFQSPHPPLPEPPLSTTKHTMGGKPKGKKLCSDIMSV